MLFRSPFRTPYNGCIDIFLGRLHALTGRRSLSYFPILFHGQIYAYGKYCHQGYCQKRIFLYRPRDCNQQIEKCDCTKDIGCIKYLPRFHTSFLLISVTYSVRSRSFSSCVASNRLKIISRSPYLNGSALLFFS